LTKLKCALKATNCSN